MKPERSDSGSKQVKLVQSEESYASRDLSDNEAFDGLASIPFKQSSTISSISTILAPPRILPIRLTCSEQSTKVYWMYLYLSHKELTQLATNLRYDLEYLAEKR